MKNIQRNMMEAFRSIFGESYLEYPKPIELMKRLINAVISERYSDGFFLWLANFTAHANMQLNAER